MSGQTGREELHVTPTRRWRRCSAESATLTLPTSLRWKPVRLELLETAQLQFDNLLEQQSQDPEILLLEARTRARLGDVLEMIGQYAEAERNDQAAIDSLRILKGRSPGRRLARCGPTRGPSHGLGVLLCKMNRFKRGRDARCARPSSFASSLPRKFPDDPAATRDLADTRYSPRRAAGAAGGSLAPRTRSFTTRQSRTRRPSLALQTRMQAKPDQAARST